MASGDAIQTSRRLFRLLEGLAGATGVDVRFHPTFDFGRAHTAIVPQPAGALAHAGRESLALTCSTPLRLESDGVGGLHGTLEIAARDRLWISLRYGTDADLAPPAIDPMEAEAALQRTLEYWTWWSGLCEYRGPYHDLVRRSALTLKLLTFNPTGALIAAPTTSLPEELGGVRNWDYRYIWLRDSSLILDALQAIGYHQEALAFFDWLQRLCLDCRGQVQAVYTVDGGAELAEHTLGHLEGYRGSRPVRVGNTAAEQNCSAG